MGKNTVFISAKDGSGTEKLLERIAQELKPTQRRMKVLLPYSEAGLLSAVRESGKVYSEEYLENGIKAEVLADFKTAARLEEYIKED